MFAQKDKSGFSLIELLVAIAFISVIITVILTMNVFNASLWKLNEDKTKAYFYASESLEAIKLIDWQYLIDGDYHLLLQANTWVLVENNEIIEEKYTRNINIASVQREFTENGHVKVKCQREGEFVVFEIIDTGIGIKEEHFSHLFEKFYQAGMGYSRKHEGVGLGLSITKQLLDLQGGMISVKSVYGKGSSFTIKIPIRYKKSKEYIALGKKNDSVKTVVEKKENEHLNPLEKEDMAIKNLFDNINEKNVFKKLKGGAKNVKKKYTLHRG